MEWNRLGAGTIRMSVLSDKILTYSPEVYYRLNQAYTNAPTNLGSAGSTTFALNNEAPTLNTTGGIHGQGSWNFGFGRGIFDNTTTSLSVSSNTTNSNLGFIDADWSGGFWFKTNFTLSTANAASNWQIANFGGSSTTRALLFSIVGGSAGAVGSKGKLVVSATGATSYTSSMRLDDQQWHYIAFRVVPNGTTYTASIYVDGVFRATMTPTVSTGLTAQWRLGGGSQSTLNANNDWTTVEFSDYYHASSASIDATAISQIWTAGNTPSNNLKYWNGTAWTVPTNKYQWDGINWVTMVGKYWNGTTWTTIT